MVDEALEEPESAALGAHHYHVVGEQAKERVTPGPVCSRSRIPG
jgi:hypothetical protein